MTDFIFNVDLSTTYVILRRDFFTPQDETGHLSPPIGAGFYYDAASANAAARAHCVKEAKEAKEAKEDPNGLGLMSESAVHLERDGLYVGGCVTREEGRDRFEVRVTRLKARGSWMRGGGGGAMMEGEAGRGGSRCGGGGLAVVSEEGEEDRKMPETPLLRVPTGSRIGRLFSRKTKD